MEALEPWFHLKSVPGIGNHLFKRLLDRFGSPQAALAAPSGELLAVEGVTRRVVQAMRSHGLPPAAAAEIDAARRRGYRIVTLNDGDYPPLLREIPDPPPFLYVSGRLANADRCIAVVGSRNATTYDGWGGWGAGILAIRSSCIGRSRRRSWNASNPP